MAPRKGGGFSSYSDSDDSSSSLWTEETRLSGSNFEDPYVLAQFVIQVVCLAALIIVAITSRTIKKQSQSLRALFRWFRFGMAMAMALAYFSFAMIYTILWETETVVAAVYYLISSILYSFAYLADIFLLVTIFALLTQLNKRIALSNFLTKPQFIWTYSIFCAILFALYLAILALRIQYHVEATQNGFYSLYNYDVSYSDYDYYVQILYKTAKINIAYNALYMVASLSVLGLATSTATHLLKEQNAKQKLIAISVVALVALPLFLRSVIEFGFVAAYSLNTRETESGAVAETFFYYFFTVVIFGGLVAIAFQLSKDAPEQEQPSYDYASAELVMNPHTGPYGGNSVVANGQQGYLQGWNKQPQATQQQVSPYYEQTSVPNGEGQPHSCPTCGDSRASMQTQPIMNGQVAPPQGMNAHTHHGTNGNAHSSEATPVSPIR